MSRLLPKMQIISIYPQFLKDEDAKYSDKLKNILDSSAVVELKNLSYRNWKNSSHDYLKSNIAKETLFLFDQDLTKEGGSDREGIKIIKDILSKNDRLFCGLLSHTFEPDNEYDDWKRFSEEHQIDKDRFLLIAKRRLEEDETGFVRMLRLTLMNRACGNFKDEISNIITKTIDESKKEINDLNIYDFESIVFQTSIKEGIWEPDTLFRLYQLFQRDKVRLQALTNRNLHESSDKIRQISSIKIDSNVNTQSRLWKIQRQEYYEEGNHINRLRMPIVLGDIFQMIDNNTKKFILIAPPCSLMIRKKGERANQFNQVILAEIAKEKKESKNIDHYYELPYFDEDYHEGEYIVNFSKTYTVLLCILDLCVFNENGQARMSIDDPRPEWLIPSWKMRFDKLEKEFKKIIRNFKDKGANQEVLKYSIPRASLIKNGLFKVDIVRDEGKEEVKYNCKRFGRLCQPRASALLTKYAQYISRTAFERDFIDKE